MSSHHPDPLHAAVMRAARPPRCLHPVPGAILTGATPFDAAQRRPSSIPADSECAGDIPLPVPHWGIHDGTWTPPADSAVAALDAGDPRPAPVLRESVNAARTRGRLEGALIGFVLAMLVVVAGCTVFAAVDREPIAAPIKPAALGSLV